MRYRPHIVSQLRSLVIQGTRSDTFPIKTIDGTPNEPTCYLCGKGDNSVQHWIHFCPVTTIAASILIGNVTTIGDVLLLQELQLREQIICIALIATLHRDAVAFDLFKTSTPQQISGQGLSGLTRILSNAAASVPTCFELPANLVEIRCETSRGSECYHCQHISFAQPACISDAPTALKHKQRSRAFAKDNRPPGTQLAVFNPCDPTILRIQGETGHGINAEIVQKRCQCGEVHALLIAIAEVHQGEPIQAAGITARAQRTLILQTDGSAVNQNSDGKACGGGTAIFLHSPNNNEVTLEKLVAHPFTSANDSFEAEAFAFAAGVLDLVKVLQQKFAEGAAHCAEDIVVQCDNKALVDYLQGLARIRNVEVVKAIQDALNRLRQVTPQFAFEFIPREANTAADFAAGIASKICKQIKEEGVEEGQAAITAVNIPILEAEAEGQVQLANKSRLIQLGLLRPHKGPIVTLVEATTFKIPQGASWSSDKLKNEVALYLQVTGSHASRHGSTRGLTSQVGQALQEKLPLLEVTYVAKNEYGQGRLYPEIGAVAGQKLSKVARHILFGADHMEIDLSKAHFAMFLEAAKYHPYFSAMRTEDALQLVKRNIENTPFAHANEEPAKLLLYLLLNTNSARQRILEKSFFVTHELNEFIGYVHRCKPSLIEFALKKGYAQAAPGLNERNQIYFAAEFLESIIMRTFLACLAQSVVMTSVVLIHDGVLIAPSPPISCVEAAMRSVAQILQIGVPSCRAISLLPQHIQACRAHICKSSVRMQPVIQRSDMQETVQGRQSTITEFGLLCQGHPRPSRQTIISSMHPCRRRGRTVRFGCPTSDVIKVFLKRKTG